jgi:hypothetical protein
MLLIKTFFLRVVLRCLSLVYLKPFIHCIDSLNVHVVVLHDPCFCILGHCMLDLAFEVIQKC